MKIVCEVPPRVPALTQVMCWDAVLVSARQEGQEPAWFLFRLFFSFWFTAPRSERLPGPRGAWKEELGGAGSWLAAEGRVTVRKRVATAAQHLQLDGGGRRQQR